MRQPEPATVGDVMNKLRWMRRHVGAKDRDTLDAAVAAIEELATRLHEATHIGEMPARPRGGVTITTIPDDDERAAGVPD